MLKKRLIACLVIKNGIVVQSIGFKKYLPVGKPEIAVEFLNAWGIDEIILLDIEATRQNRKPDFDLVKRISEKNFVPLTVGGGIRSLYDMQKLIHYGADKICMNKEALASPDIINKAAKIFGNQCIVISMDVGFNKQGNYEVFQDSGSTPAGFDPVAWSKQVESLGAGEIFLNSIERDGSKKGYDIDLIKRITGAVNLPVIACGGAGHPSHFWDGFTKANAPACAAGNFFHFTEHSPIVVKSYLKERGLDVRLETYADYSDIDFDISGRIAKRPEDYLEKLRFEYHPKEVI